MLLDLSDLWKHSCLSVVFPHVTRSSCISHKVSKSYTNTPVLKLGKKAEIVSSTRHMLTTYDNTDMSGTADHDQV